MSEWNWLPLLLVIVGGLGTWLLLPHRHGSMKPRTVHVVGLLLIVVAAALLLGLCAQPGPFLPRLFFNAFAVAAVIGGVLMITSVNPVHSALWFAAVVLSTTGLYLLAGAQFLAAATIIIYAGAIVVTFLYVIMLAQASGAAIYDRSARAPGRATLACFVLLWALVYSLVSLRGESSLAAPAPAGVVLSPASRIAEIASIEDRRKVARVIEQAIPATSRIAAEPTQPIPGVPAPHVAALGGTLFTDHLIAVQVAGVLLFVALVAAAAIATPKAPVRPTTRGGARSV